MLLPIVIGTIAGTVAVYGFLFGLVIGAEASKGAYYDKKTNRWTNR